MQVKTKYSVGDIVYTADIYRHRIDIDKYEIQAITIKQIKETDTIDIYYELANCCSTRPENELYTEQELINVFNNFLTESYK